MTTRVVETEYQLERLIELLRQRDLPITVSIRKGKDRTVEQNRLQRKWIGEAAEQLGHDKEFLRGQCKLEIGVPIMRECAVFKAAYDQVIKPLDYDKKIMAMCHPLNFPVTQLMLVPQKIRYLDEMCRKFVGLGVNLTDPNQRK